MLFPFITFLIFSDGYSLSSEAHGGKSSADSDSFFPQTPLLAEYFLGELCGEFDFVERGIVVSIS